MQERKIDTNQLIGFGLMILLFLAYFWFTKPTEEEIQAEKAKQEQIARQQNENITGQPVRRTQQQPLSTTDTAAGTVPLKTLKLENDKLLLEFTNRGAQLSKVQLKEYNAYNEDSEGHVEPLYLIHDGNANFGIHITDNQGRKTDLSQRNFTARQNGNSVVFTTNENGGTIQYTYTLTKDYDLDFSVKSQNFNRISNQNKAGLTFNMDALTQEKGKDWEKRVTDIHYSIDNSEDYTTGDFATDADETLDWVAFKQQFFTAILEKENGLKNAKMNIETPDEDIDSLHSKYFTFSSDLNVNGELNDNFTWHFLPLEFNLMKDYGKNFEDIIPFGWGIFGWINEWIILPTFRFMATWGLGYGWVIALLTIFIKLVTSPIMYKQYKQSAMMRVLKPDMDELSKKYPNKDDAMKKQQEVMALYRTAGVNPLAGCLPALLQIPIFYALFSFFPNIIDLRGKSFLWAEDLTAFDSILDLPFDIPFYGAHISLFALLYVVTMVIYFRTSGSMMQAPTQEGMPDMRIIMYIMPIMFIFFLNSYASGLSWYYFVSNAINIGLIFVIKNWMIDDDKIHAKIQANKAKPSKNKKKSAWSQRLEEAMKKAQEQQEMQKKLKK